MEAHTREPERAGTLACVALVNFDRTVAASGAIEQQRCQAIRRDLLVRYDLSDKTLANELARVPHAFAREELLRRGHALDNPTLSLDATRLWRCGDHGVSDYLTSSCATVGDCLQTISDFVPLLHDGLSLEVHEQGAETLLICRPKPGVVSHRTIAEAVLGKIALKIRHGLGGNAPECRAIHFLHAPPNYERAYSCLFRAPVEFRQSHDALVFSTEALQTPFATADGALHALLLELATTELRSSGAQGQTVEHVRALALDELPRNGANQAEVAKRCGVSVATLRRRLERSGVRYRDLLADLQREVSTRALSDPNADIEQVCRKAGFTHKAAFYRAFKRWYGCTPAEYRRTRTPSSQQ
ncbi:MAG: AraC family transcriptional regulator ligand-binding domain-containing protein [Myxococcales bacterium]|nr:AraC family transcriptional regulator ligand-binding domain-containing protein [Myxococcales bacterium]